MGLAGMELCTDLGGLCMLRPLLHVSRQTLRQYLCDLSQNWREDASNASDDYLRNRVRRLLAGEPALARDLLDLGKSCQAVRQWARSNAPALAAGFATQDLADLPLVLASESARAWLIARGAPPDKITPEAISRLIAMARDAASAARAHFPGRILVKRKGGTITAEG